MSKSDSQKARAKVYRNKTFRRELMGGLGIEALNVHVASCLDALLETRRLPTRSENNARGAAVDAALIMIAVGTIQTNREVMLSLTDRLGAMTLRDVVDTGSPSKPQIPVDRASDLLGDLATAIEEYWAAPDGAFLDGLCHVAFQIKIADAPADDKAMLSFITGERLHTYSVAGSPSADRERPRRVTRGGMGYMPAALANFADQLRHDLDGTAAAIELSHPSAGELNRETDANEGLATDEKRVKILPPEQFAQLFRPGDAGYTEADTTSVLRFEMLGRAVVGGVEYHRDGGPSEERKYLAAQIMEIGGMAIETADRHPQGWVVVEAIGRPYCRLGEGQIAFHRGAQIIVFESEDESSRFMKHVNGQAQVDPSMSAIALPAQPFAKEAARHAEMYRRFLNDAGIVVDLEAPNVPNKSTFSI